jgi:hypothetical protein
MGGLLPIVFFLLRLAEDPKELLLYPKCRILYIASGFIFISANTSYADTLTTKCNLGAFKHSAAAIRPAL